MHRNAPQRIRLWVSPKRTLLHPGTVLRGQGRETIATPCYASRRPAPHRDAALRIRLWVSRSRTLLHPGTALRGQGRETIAARRTTTQRTTPQRSASPRSAFACGFLRKEPSFTSAQSFATKAEKPPPRRVSQRAASQLTAPSRNATRRLAAHRLAPHSLVGIPEKNPHPLLE